MFGNILGHVAAVSLGLVLMVVGLAMGVTMIMLPVGVVVGLQRRASGGILAPILALIGLVLLWERCRNIRAAAAAETGACDEDLLELTPDAAIDPVSAAEPT